MATHARKLILLAGLLLFLIGSFLAWRSMHPVLTDKQQILANLDGLTAAVEARQVRGVMGYAAKDFTFQGNSRSDLNRGLQGAFFQWRDVQLHTSHVQVDINGDQAVSKGNYSLTHSQVSGGPEAEAGTFSLKWQKRDGQWLVTSADVTGPPPGG